MIFILKNYIFPDDFSMCIQLCDQDVTFIEAGKLRKQAEEFRNKKKRDTSEHLRLNQNQIRFKI